MLADVVACLTCPVCGEALAASGGVLLCANGHTHDVAREGYVNLLGGHRAPGTADAPDMVRAREAFLASGRYRPIADEIARAVREFAPPPVPGCIVEIGAGTGYYLAAALDAAPTRTGLALDISKHAAKRAARAHSRMGSVVCDAWSALPLRDRCAAAVLDVFAPRNAAEIARILDPSGAFVVVTPTGAHLREIIGPLGLVSVDADKERRLEEQLATAFIRLESVPVVREMSLDHATIREVVAMGPSARHMTADDLDRRISSLPEEVRASMAVTVSVFRPR